jgi:hypothetical protein
MANAGAIAPIAINPVAITPRSVVFLAVNISINALELLSLKT